MSGNLGHPTLATNPTTGRVQDVCSCVRLPAQYITQLFVQHVSAGLSTPAADAYDQLHVVTSSSQPQKQSAMALVASMLQGPPTAQRIIYIGIYCEHANLLM